MSAALSQLLIPPAISAVAVAVVVDTGDDVVGDVADVGFDVVAVAVVGVVVA